MTPSTDFRRQLFARMQLLVFVAMLVVSSVHVHETYEKVAVDCTECQHNVHHSGHLSSAIVSLDDCVLCQFAGLNYLPATLIVAVVLLSAMHVSRCQARQESCRRAVGVVCLRAPPVSFC